MSSLYNLGVDLLTNPSHTRWIAPLLVAAEAVLCGLIIWRVPYTEIDWSTYMTQISLFHSGERSYPALTGPTGPLVYPAFHVYLYSALYHLTDEGTNILRAQIIFAGIYLLTLSFVLACYRRVNAPPWVLVPLVLSKRLHSIFLLRLFNDGPAALGLWVSIYCLQRRWWVAGALAWGVALGVKMTLLLGLPGLAMVLVQGAGRTKAVFAGMLVVILHIAIAAPFLNTRENAWDYVRCAFNLGRKFLFKWTVNWRFVGEEMFLSERFAGQLLVLHVSLLLVFVNYKWVKPSSKSLVGFVKRYIGPLKEEEEKQISRRVTSTFVMNTVLGSMVIGLLCARSLHYQFFAYLGWATPYLLWREGTGPFSVLLHCAFQEFAWLQFPSTNVSSSLVVISLALQVVCAFPSPYDQTSPQSRATGTSELRQEAG